jgi:DNA-binding winged helix-turn-helix (wHTH) protein
MDPRPADESKADHAAVFDYRFGRFSIDVAARHLLRGGEIIPLSSKAFETLHLLVTQRDRVVTKDELVHVVWPDTLVSDDSLTQVISSLRRSLGDAELIATIPRRGYRFIAPVIAFQPAPPVDAFVAPAEGSDDEHHVLALDPPAIAAASKGSRHVLSHFSVWIRGAAVLATLAVGVILGRVWTDRAQPIAAAAPVVRFLQEAPPGTHIVSGGMLSPDGRISRSLGKIPNPGPPDCGFAV